MAPRPGTGANQGLVRRHNLATLLGHVHRRGRVTRAELTSAMGLNRSTIAALVSELEAAHLVAQKTPQVARRGAGRPSREVLPGPREVSVLAVELRVDRVIGARVGLGGRLLAHADLPNPRSGDPAEVAASVRELSRKLVADAPESGALVGMGVAVPGIVGTADGVVHMAPNLNWTDVGFRDLLGRTVGGCLPIGLGNDADLGALAEHVRGVGTACDHMVFVNGSVGVGGGIIAGGQAMRGAWGYAGEVGHMLVNPDGGTCRCGRRGCWETEIGSQAVAAAVDGDPLDLDALGKLLGSVVEPTARLREVGDHLGSGLANLVNLLNPEVIVLGGLLRNLYPVVRAESDRALAEGAHRAARRRTQVRLPGLGADSIILGAAELAFGELLADPMPVVARSAGALAALSSA
ncbi:MAG: ROK family protein [Nocardioidaceae bacterium]